jgi:3-dehydroquinate dehydratase
VIKAYTDAKPTPETSTEIIKDIADEFKQSPNGVRMILVAAKVYVKKDPNVASVKTTKEGGTSRISKEDQIKNLRETITDLGGEVNEEVLDKLTGKAAEYFASVIKTIAASE